MEKTSSFYNLDPDKVLLAAELAGFRPTGEFTQLNSYENRVFDLRLETQHDGEFREKNLISKFYRPQRWSREAIQEEHSFLMELNAEGIPAVAPLSFSGKTILDFEGMYVSFFPKVLGRMPQEFLRGELKKVGRLMAQVHNVGARSSAPHRPVLDSHYYGGWETLDHLQSWIAPEVKARYTTAAENILNAIDDSFNPDEFIRIHGDCHKGNLLDNGQQYFLVDFDDFVNGPVIQDFWMLLSGDSDMLNEEQAEIISGYEELREFPDHQWSWIPMLRGLRIISYAGWIAKRWDDPSFPRLFPDFNTYRYWAEEVEALEKISWQLEN
jgi:Ser/Thr protein kinase RdoA (MazF antagonist)